MVVTTTGSGWRGLAGSGWRVCGFAGWRDLRVGGFAGWRDLAGLRVCRLADSVILRFVLGPAGDSGVAGVPRAGVVAGDVEPLPL